MQSKTPTWAVITGILMMLIGGCGLKNDLQFINIREMLSFKDKIINKINTAEASEDSTALAQRTADSINIPRDTSIVSNDKIMGKDSTNQLTINGEDSDINDVKDLVGSMFNMSETTINRIILFGYIGIFFSILFVLGGLFLLIKKSFSIKLVYIALGANVGFIILRWILLSGEDIKGIFALATGIGSALSIFLTIILFVVVVSCDKSDYEEVFQD